MSSHSGRILRCVGCTRRIKPHHPHVGVIDLETGREISYHARCQGRAAAEIVAGIERGKATLLRYHHSSKCPDEHPGFGCSGGCFDTLAAAN